MHSSRPSVIAAATLIALALSGVPQASAQNLFVVANRTIAGGNPINGSYGQVRIGEDAAFNPFVNISADITGGTMSFVAALRGSTVNISGGTIGLPPTASAAFSSLAIVHGSTVNLSGGSLLGPAFVYGSNGGAGNIFNMSGGSVAGWINVGDGGTVNISGGSIVASGPFSGGVQSTGSGTMNITGGSMGYISSQNYSGGLGATVNFGGTATVSSISSGTGVTNISGGSIGAGGVMVRNDGVANFTGSGLTVNQLSTGRMFDDSNYVNIITSSYTVTGTLANGSAVNTTVSAGETYSNSGSTATFNAPALAPDRYVTTNESVSGFYNNIHVGIDETLSIPSSPTATIAAGADTVFLTTYSGSVTSMTGGIVRGGITVTEQSSFNMSGGEAPGGITSTPGTTVHVSGGAAAYLGVGGTASVSGGTIDYVEMFSGSTLIVQGSGLTAIPDAPVGHFWDSNAGINYLNAANFQVAGTLADGTPFDQTVLASGASGTTGQQTVAGPQAAPNLSVTTDTTTNTIYNVVEIGNALISPVVSFAAGTDVGNVYIRNQSRLNVQGGLVNGTIYAGKDAQVNISGGTLNRVYQGESGAGRITVSGGTTKYIAPRNQLLMTGGMLTTLDTYGGAQVRIEGGDVTKMWLYGGAPANPTSIVVAGGTVGTIDYRTLGNVVTILGGSVGQIWGNGGSAYIYGGSFGSDALINFRTNITLFDIFGHDLSLSGATLGTFTDSVGTAHNGVWWTVTGILDSGANLNTRYFERDASLGGPTGLVFNVVPSPGTLAALVFLPALSLGRRRRAASVG